MSQLLIVVLFGVVGLAALLRGMFLVSPALAWVVFGLACLVIAGWPVLRSRFLR